MEFDRANTYILAQLRSKLPSNLYYHNINHTLDVQEATVRIAKNEGIENAQDLILLKTGALFHDLGFVHSHFEHEAVSIQLAEKELPQFGYNAKEIKVICGLIAATKIPQSPANLWEQILCDADLDYLGRNDYDIIADKLKREILFTTPSLKAEDWLRMQINFLARHSYFTRSQQALRSDQKIKKLAELKNQLAHLTTDQ